MDGGNPYEHLKTMQNKIAQANAGCNAQPTQNQGILTGLTPREETIVERLQRKLNRIEHDNSKTARALMILQQHPEFEDFLWLLRNDVL
jgi:DNA-binding ferritin-like protein